MRFDWYQPTIPEKPMVIVEQLLARLAPGGEVVESRGRHNYRQAFTVMNRERERVAVVLAGGSNGDPNVTSSGEACDTFVPLVRDLWPKHRVTRVDAAEDFRCEGGYERLEGVCRAITRAHKVKGLAFVPDDPADGRTYSMGSRASDVSARLYDKTAERRRWLPIERHGEVPDHVTRLEVAVRPRKEWRDFAAHMEPEHFWGLSGWTRELAAAAMGMDVERITMQAGRESDHERAMRFMLSQYGPTLLRMHADHGDWAAVGMQIGDDLERMRRAKR